MGLPPTTKNYLAKNVSSAKVEKPCYKVMSMDMEGRVLKDI